jgi:hypothetical protein
MSRADRQAFIFLVSAVVLDTAVVLLVVLRHDVHWGDIPTWVAAIGTVAAIGVALFQIDRERRERQRLERREADERHRSHARLISAVPGADAYVAVTPPHRANDSPIDLLNTSQEPVYNIVVGLVYIQGANAPQTTEAFIEAERRITGGWPPTTTVPIVLPGHWRVWVREMNWAGAGGMGARLGAEVAFTDRNGSHWIRRANGDLEQLPSDALAYFSALGFWPPYEFQQPVPLPN